MKNQGQRTWLEEIRMGLLMVSFASMYQVPPMLAMSESKTARTMCVQGQNPAWPTAWVDGSVSHYCTIGSLETNVHKMYVSEILKCICQALHDNIH